MLIDVLVAAGSPPTLAVPDGTGIALSPIASSWAIDIE